LSLGLFSDSEVAALCLRDRRRTELFREAIRRAVRPGDLVVDAGAGSGIFSLFAAQAGARRVIAIEALGSLCELLRTNARRNGFERVIEVVHGDVREVELPQAVDVVLAEMIDTWLLDEAQLPALASLRERGVIGVATRLVPERYEGWLTLGEADFGCYGLEVAFPVHDWPDLTEDGGWSCVPFRSVTEPTHAFDQTFAAAEQCLPPISIELRSMRTGTVNAARLTGEVHLGNGLRIGATPSFNGAKIVPIDPVHVRRGEPVLLRLGSSPPSRRIRPALGARQRRPLAAARARRPRRGAGGTARASPRCFRVLSTLIRPDRGTTRVLGLDPGRTCDRGAPAGGPPLAPLQPPRGADRPREPRGRGAVPGAPAHRGALLPRLAEVGLAERADDPVMTFSAGMRKRLTLARTLLQEAEVVLLDEPYGQLDPPGFRLVDDVVAGLRARGATVLWRRTSSSAGRRCASAGSSSRRDGWRWTGPARDLVRGSGLDGAGLRRAARERARGRAAEGGPAAVAHPRPARRGASSSAPPRLLLFSFAVGPDSAAVRQHSAGVPLAGPAARLDAHPRRELPERDGAARPRGQLLLPARPAALFYGKAISNWLQLSLLGVALVPVMVVLYDAGAAACSRSSG
jgi:SAM-dependent methyltransferase